MGYYTSLTYSRNAKIKKKSDFRHERVKWAKTAEEGWKRGSCRFSTSGK